MADQREGESFRSNEPESRGGAGGSFSEALSSRRESYAGGALVAMLEAKDGRRPCPARTGGEPGA
jgi:hypothetical protein